MPQAVIHQRRRLSLTALLRFGRLAPAIAFVVLLGLPRGARAQDDAGSVARTFDIPAGPAEATLRRFSEQSGLQLVFASDIAEGVQTNPVKGNFTPTAAGDRLLAGTELLLVYNAKTGIVSVIRKPAEAGTQDGSKKNTALSPAQPAAGSPGSATSGGDGTVTLKPFEVQAAPDKSYGVLNSRNITAFNVALDHMPVSADIFDNAFMNDVGSASLEDTLGYSAGIGISGLDAAGSAYEREPGDYRNQSYIQIRGLMTPNMQRDSLLYMGTLGAPGGTSTGFTSNFDLEQVQVIFGPEALLYDGGGAGGVINAVSKQARLGEPAFGSDMFRVDQYGSKYNEIDYGAGTDQFAVRVAAVNSTTDTRRVDLGDQLDGLYTQMAAQFGKTTVRVSVEQATDAAVVATRVALTSPKDPEFEQNTGDKLTYLLATNQAGQIDNGQINWGDVSSLHGDMNSNTVISQFGELEADSQWTSWLSTQLQAGMSDFTGWHTQETESRTLYSPNASSNPLGSGWVTGMNGSISTNVAERPYHNKGLRYSVLLTNDVFGGKGKSQTTIGADYLGIAGGVVTSAYYLANSNWQVYNNTTNPLPAGVVPSGAARDALGRVPFGVGAPGNSVTGKNPDTIFWNVNNGVIEYPFFSTGTPHVVVNGHNYVLAQVTPFVKGLVSPSNPLGEENSSVSSGDVRNEADNDGVYATNYTEWMDGKLDTLLGVRLEHDYTYTVNGPNANGSSPTDQVDSHNFNFNAGAIYHLLPALAPYFSVSNSYLLPPNLNTDPDGNVMPISEALGGEAGVKIGRPDGWLSGSIAYYHSQAKNEQFIMSSTLTDEIDPSGLNGLPNRGNGYAANTESDGIEVTLTANPVPAWRMRLSTNFADGRVQTTNSYSQVYNDQFYENSQQQVTYSDGTLVYVNPNSYTGVYNAGNYAAHGAVPLTVAMLSTPSNLYYANPNLTSGVISNSSSAYDALTSVDPVHGPIRTGNVGLPISDFQLIASDIPNLALPGNIPVTRAGDQTTGYPELSYAFTNAYEFPSGPFKGFTVGGTVRQGWKLLDYYYYPLSYATNPTVRAKFYSPSYTLVDPLLGYTRKIGRVVFSSQLNVYNVFNHYHVIIYPDEISGWTDVTALNAGFDQEPRKYQWTNTIKF